MAPRKTRKETSNIIEAPVETPKLPPRDHNPPKLLILPRDVSPDARIVSLAHPSNGQHCRYLYCQRTGFYELTAAGSGTKGVDLQSCLLIQDGSDKHSQVSGKDSVEPQCLGESSGYVLEHAQFLIATPLDARLLLMPLFESKSSSGKGRPNMARTADDLLDDLSSTSEHMALLLRYPSVRRLFERQLEGVCDSVNAMGDKAYKPNAEKLLELLLQKAKSLVEHAWPKSLENHVQKLVEPPAVIVAMKESETVNGENSGNAQGIGDQNDRQHDPSKEIRKKIDKVSEWNPSKEVLEQMRLKTAIDFIFSLYVPSSLKSTFNEDIVSKKMVDLEQANEHLRKVQSLKEEAIALRKLSQSATRKRCAEEEDDEAQEAREEKRRKKEEEEKKMKQETRAMKELKKVNTSGMQKLSSFFSKKAPISTG